MAPIITTWGTTDASLLFFRQATRPGGDHDKTSTDRSSGGLFGGRNNDGHGSKWPPPEDIRQRGGTRIFIATMARSEVTTWSQLVKCFATVKVVVQDRAETVRGVLR